MGAGGGEQQHGSTGVSRVSRTAALHAEN